jgi:cation transporter-like permease
MHPAPFGSQPTRESLRQIIAENLVPVVFASMLSVIGGIGLALVEKKLYFLLPVLITIPALADMVGDFSAIIASKSVALIEEKKLPRDWAHSKVILGMATHMLWISIGYSLIVGMASLFIASRQGFALSPEFISKFLIILILINVMMVLFLIVFSIRVGSAVAYHGHDPDNFLIPIATSIADVGVLLLFSLMVWLFF